MVHGSEIIGQKFNSDHLQKLYLFLRLHISKMFITVIEKYPNLSKHDNIFCSTWNIYNKYVIYVLHIVLEHLSKLQHNSKFVLNFLTDIYFVMYLSLNSRFLTFI